MFLVLLHFLADLIQGANNEEKGDKGEQETPFSEAVFLAELSSWKHVHQQVNDPPNTHFC